jgi:pimeloyl-ACP methyl ester carboxylesterase
VNEIQSDDGTQIACWVSGAGPPLILVHGTAADHTRWPSVLPALEAQCSVYAIDRRGRGESGDTGPYAIEREFEDVAAVVDSIHEPVSVLGHSYGALCVLGAALLTTNIKQLILYEPYIHTGVDVYPPGIADRIQALVDAGDRDGALSAMFRELVQMSEHDIAALRSLPSWNVRVASAHTIARETSAEEQYKFIPERFAKLNTPTLLLLGGKSPPFLKDVTQMLHGALPHSRIAVMVGQQHIAMNTAPELFAAEVLRFLLQ